MEIALDLIKILLPAGLVLYGIYLVVKSFLEKEFQKKLLELRTKNTETITPVRLTAYERVTLFLERIAPSNLLVRLNDPAFTVYQFQSKLLAEIRSEYNHNISQQIYMSDQAWNLVQHAMEDVVSLINKSAQELNANDKGLELSKMVFEKLAAQNKDSVAEALSFVKNEIRTYF